MNRNDLGTCHPYACHVAADWEGGQSREHDVASAELPEAFRILTVVVIVGTILSWITWLAIQIPTYRHTSGERRQQLKWLYSGGASACPGPLFSQLAEKS